MRCPSCEKFVSMEMQDPEQENIEIEADALSPEEAAELSAAGDSSTATVRASYRIVRACADCGEELKEATLEMETEVEIPAGHTGDDHELEVEETSVDATEKGGGRYAKSYFGAHVYFSVTCTCEHLEVTGEMSDEIAASHMDELV